MNKIRLSSLLLLSNLFLTPSFSMELCKTQETSLNHEEQNLKKQFNTLIFQIYETSLTEKKCIKKFKDPRYYMLTQSNIWKHYMSPPRLGSMSCLKNQVINPIRIHDPLTKKTIIIMSHKKIDGLANLLYLNLDKPKNYIEAFTILDKFKERLIFDDSFKMSNIELSYQIYNIQKLATWFYLNGRFRHPLFRP